MDWPRSRLELYKTGASETAVTIDETIGTMIAEVAGDMIAAVIATAVMIAETTEEMIGVNLMTAKMLSCVSRHRLPSRVKEQEITIEMTTRLKMLHTWSSPP